MKKLLACFCLLIFLYACSKEEPSNKIITKDEMYNVLIDMHLADASLDFNPNGDSLLIKARERYNYIFTKYNIDSAKFNRSLTYYIRHDTKGMMQVYQNVADSLNRFREKLSKSSGKFNLPISGIMPDTIYYNFKVPFIIDTLLLQSKKNLNKAHTLNRDTSNVILKK